MKQLLKLLFLLLCSSSIYSQISSGKYDSGLNLAYNLKTKKITGYFESYSGYDEETNKPKFSCIFYISGSYNENVSSIETYNPLEYNDKITGVLKVNNDKNIAISLQEEHGGCWNVFHFSNGFANFNIVQKTNWLEIRYVTLEKVYFYHSKDEDSRLKSYLIKGDIVHVEKEESDWIYCVYIGEKTTKGWIKKESVNK